MKTISFVLALAFLVISAVMISLVRRGGALKPAGVIKPAAIGTDPTLIGKQIAIRLYPDFHATQFVIWWVEPGSTLLAEVPHTVWVNYRNPKKPSLHDLRTETADNCVENCWYIQELGRELPDVAAQKTKAGPTAEVFIQHFDREEKVPEVCENQKLLTLECMRPVSVREVRRKLKTPAPHFFMQRYLKSQFYLYVEKEKL